VPPNKLTGSPPVPLERTARKDRLHRRKKNGGKIGVAETSGVVIADCHKWIDEDFPTGHDPRHGEVIRRPKAGIGVGRRAQRLAATQQAALRSAARVKSKNELDRRKILSLKLRRAVGDSLFL